MAGGGEEVALAAIALAGSICAGFFALVAKQNKTHEKIATAIDSLEKGSSERNGHLGDQSVEIANIAKEISKKLDSITTQEVKDQHVHHQIIDKE